MADNEIQTPIEDTPIEDVEMEAAEGQEVDLTALEPDEPKLVLFAE